ncbi:MAG: riboflavin synthase [Alphaproteobacteria bacterium]|nr:MAG: riboflavin synthase [Alphaproteobacteria bacterium]TAF15070.1 MAG: riboflavin synthase [Alphaproteobacteria bacterium]TAF40476.1 MAG: riboflavin synthase [Alphaproteobacteria bacterium]TAF76907.1 MAG: riboflavin synthase [Alphaproteobacteria bacterium]
MFTGIITHIGTVRTCDVSPEGTRMTIAMPPRDQEHPLVMGASIAHDGCCLTITQHGVEDGGMWWYGVDLSSHTLAHTTLGAWRVGQKMNIERALRMGDELGGHMVSGHVDGVAMIASMHDEGGVRHYTIRAPESLMCFIANKGSVALDGTSLTVTWVEGECFGLTLIPHTLHVTTWGEKKAGDALNIEIDVLARYAARLQVR